MKLGAGNTDGNTGGNGSETGNGADELDSHALLMQMKEAVAEAYMNDFHGKDEVYVTYEDFLRAGYIMAVHRETRAKAMRESDKDQAKTAIKKGKLAGMERDAANVVQKQRQASRVNYRTAKNKILDKLREQGGSGVLTSTGLGPSVRNVWDKAIYELMIQKIIVDTGRTEKAGNQAMLPVYALAVGTNDLEL